MKNVNWKTLKWYQKIWFIIAFPFLLIGSIFRSFKDWNENWQ